MKQEKNKPDFEEIEFYMDYDESRILNSIQCEKSFKWREWVFKIPSINFPSHWNVKIIPPFAGAMIRFMVSTEKMKKKESISVYLDCYNMLGYMPEPYWEAYSPSSSDSPERFFMKDVNKLISYINKQIKSIEKSA